LGLSLLGAGCGYNFADEGSGLPSTASTIYVAHFRNLSRDTGVEDEFARYLKDEIANHKRLVLVDDPAQADLRLSGTIRALETNPTGFNSVNEPSSYAVSIFLDARLMDRADKVIWSTKGLTGGGSFATVATAVVTTSPAFLRQNLRARDVAALPDSQLAHTERDVVQGQTMATLARDFYSSMSEGF
jgi:hypothetical protein